MFPFLKKARPIYGFLSITVFINQAYVLYFLSSNQPVPADLVVLTVILINLIAFLFALVVMWDELGDRSWFKHSPIKPSESAKSKLKENEHEDSSQ